MEGEVRQEVDVFSASSYLERIGNIRQAGNELDQFRHVEGRRTSDVVGQLDEEHVGKAGLEHELVPPCERNVVFREEGVDRVAASLDLVRRLVRARDDERIESTVVPERLPDASDAGPA